VIGRAARRLHDTTEYAISLAVGCSLFEWSQFLFGMENTYLFLAGEKRKMACFLDRLADLHIEKLSRIVEARPASIPDYRDYVSGGMGALVKSVK